MNSSMTRGQNLEILWWKSDNTDFEHFEKRTVQDCFM